MSEPEAMTTAEKPSAERGNLSVTALYTAGTWGWGGLSGAELLASKDSRNVFTVTNLVLAITRLLKPGVRSLRHSLLHRHTMIDHLVTTAGARQILELAAGLSRRGVAFSADPLARYTEVDLAPMVAHKRTLLGRSEAGRQALARPGLRFVEGDVLDIDIAALVDGAEPAFVIAEGLHMYLKPSLQRALWRKVRGAMGGRGGTFVFDLIPACEEPRPGAIGNALSWLMKRFTGGRTFERDARTRDDIAAELREAGFNGVEMMEPASVAHSWGLPFPDVPTQQLLFVARVPGPAA